MVFCAICVLAIPFERPGVGRPLALEVVLPTRREAPDNPVTRPEGQQFGAPGADEYRSCCWWCYRDDGLQDPVGRLVFGVGV